ncbi:MAG: efflux RND transporter periplasmic adaptor subunit [Aquabacterium sp.]|uniref:efflux RND transporter periplasmic adaptor subunit n=1 Tax=Aquabacterium sp. TaxID=1872578 RepID=UPI001B6B7619|nr:efflux RND transporter periplasmic adaptor subunit [Aquabacterium sp.]MBP7133447.1 efflux RND transporter periplasmic adaptor subunit [Aquabacterium sp.]
MSRFPLRGRTLALIAAIVPLLILFIYVGLRSGPLAPVAVTVTSVTSEAVSPALFGIGTVEARHTHKIGPIFAGRIQRLEVQVGDQVKAGQVLGEMDPVDLEDRGRSLEAAVRRAEAVLREAEARHAFASTQAQRYDELYASRSVSEELRGTKRQELQIAAAARAVAQAEVVRVRSDREGLGVQQGSLRLVAPVDGLVVAREADPGTTVVAGQAVVEIIDPSSLWMNVRFDQISAAGLRRDLPAQIVLSSRSGLPLKGHVLRVEPKADAVTEETLAKVVFDTQPESLPPLGELAEVTVNLPALPAAPTVANATLRRLGEQTGVWKLVDGDLQFVPVKLGASDLNGRVQVREGVAVGDQVVTYSEKTLTAKSRIKVVDHIAGAPR